MPIVKRYKYMPTYTYFGVCPPDTSYGNKQLYQKWWSDNPKESRSLPTDLISSPTPQAKQWTWETSYHREHKDTVGNETCDGKLYIGTKTTQRDYYLLNQFKNGTEPNTDWALETRLRIKEISQNLGTALAEANRTRDMFIAFGSGVTKAWRHYRNIKRGKRRRLSPCDVAASELIASYGLEPLIGDLFGSVMKLQDALGQDIIRRIVVTRSASDTVDWQHSSKPYYTTTSYWETSDRVIVYVKMIPHESDFTLGNPAEIAWELVPFSFVVDWGIPVGDWLSAMDALKDVESIVGTRTRKTSCLSRITGNVNANYEVTKQGWSHYNSHERFVVGSVPMPDFPSWNPSMGFRRMVHALSLLTSLSNSCRQRNRIGLFR